MRIALFDYLVENTNPLGGIHHTLLTQLADEHEFTVFAVRFDNPRPDRIRFVRIPAPIRPLALLFIWYHLIAPIIYLWHILRTGRRFDLIQMVESNLAFGDLSYTHFCHRAYLLHHWKKSGATGLRGAARWIDHKLHAIVEPWVFRHRKNILVPSQGLAGELIAQYPFVRDRVQVLHNPIDTNHLAHPPAEYDRNGFRQALGFKPDDIVMIFIALGHFERKGLPVLMEAMASLNQPSLKLLVIGGTDDLIDRYKAKARANGIDQRIVFAGMQRNVGEHLWAADVFVFPSLYETFSLVTFQAAAAGLPIIVCRLHGVVELIEDGQSGMMVRPTAASVAEALRRFIALPPDRRADMGRSAQQRSGVFSIVAFAEAWRNFYRTNY